MRKERDNVSMLATDRMTHEQLLHAVTRRLIDVEKALADAADVQAYVDVRDALACVLELQVRGMQMQLPLE